MLKPKTADAWTDRNTFELQRFALFRAVRALTRLPEGRVEALALIRAAFSTDEGWAELGEAQELVDMIVRER